jgi:hypothetical protein
VEAGASQDIEALLTLGLLVSLGNLKTRQFTDPDIDRDLEVYIDRLRPNVFLFISPVIVALSLSLSLSYPFSIQPFTLAFLFLQAVRVELQKNWRQLSTMERYESEVRGGRLEWGLLHDTKFFKEHIRQFETSDFALVGGIARITCALIIFIPVVGGCFCAGEAPHSAADQCGS